MGDMMRPAKGRVGSLVALTPVGCDEINWPNFWPAVLVASSLVPLAVGCGGQSERTVELAPDAGVALTILDATTDGLFARPDADKSSADAAANAIADTGVDSIGDAGLFGEGPPEAAALDANDASADGSSTSSYGTRQDCANAGGRCVFGGFNCALTGPENTCNCNPACNPGNAICCVAFIDAGDPQAAGD
jgi:hypothetical protein